MLLRPNWQFPPNRGGDLYAAPVITFFTRPTSLGAPARAALQPIYPETIPAFFRLAAGDVLLMIEGGVSGVATVVAVEEFANTADAFAELRRAYGG